MLWGLIDYLPHGRELRTILELGRGAQNLSTFLVQRFPAATIHQLDKSRESINTCRRRLDPAARIVPQQQDFRMLAYEAGSFDLVVFSIVIHPSEAPDKQRLFENVHRWLDDGGIFAYADQFAGATDDLYENHLPRWNEQAFCADITDDEWNMWMQHQQDHDHHDSLIA